MLWLNSGGRAHVTVRLCVRMLGRGGLCVPCSCVHSLAGYPVALAPTPWLLGLVLQPFLGSHIPPGRGLPPPGMSTPPKGRWVSVVLWEPPHPHPTPTPTPPPLRSAGLCPS